MSIHTLINNEQAWYYKLIPATQDDKKLDVYYCSAQEKDGSLQEFELITGYRCTVIEKEAHEIDLMLQKHYRKQINTTSTQLSSKTDFLNDIIKEARQLGSSDIHIETYEDKCRVRIRIDGMLIERYKIAKSDYPAMINKLKIMSQLDISEKRLPQDGRISFNYEGGKFDIRVSILPTLHGEKIVMRLLNNDASFIDVEKLGLNDIEKDRLLTGLRKPNGLVLISGPTGSGKTTTLYAALKDLNKETRNILTIEDPIEYTLAGVNQVQLKESIGLNFGAALRTFLRQDPDIIMVGEIRDPDTANMAIRAALTGHLVLSTIHTNSAWGIISRLIDMGVQPFLVANTLNVAIAQRLVRLLCPHCKKEETLDIKELPLGYTDTNISHHHVPVGCDVCYHTGYSGRKAIYEIIPIDKELAEMIKNKQSDVTATLAEKNIPTLKQNALELFKNGDTSLEEVFAFLV